MKFRILIFFVLGLFCSCGSDEAPTPPEASPIPTMSQCLDHAPDDVFGLLSFKSFDAILDFEIAWQKSAPANRVLSSLLRTLPGFESDQGGDQKSAIHWVVSVANTVPVFEVLLPITEMTRFEKSTAAQREGPLLGNEFFFDSPHGRLYGNSIGNYVFLSEKAPSFKMKTGLLDFILAEGTPGSPIRLLVAQEKLLARYPQVVSKLKRAGLEGSEGSNMMASKLGKKYEELGSFFGAMKVGQFTIDLESERLSVELTATWTGDHELQREFSKPPCALNPLAANLSDQSYLILAHCIPSMVGQFEDFKTRLMESLGIDLSEHQSAKEIKRLSERLRSNFRAEVSSLYAQGPFPFSMLTLTQVEDAQISLNDMKLLSQWAMKAFNTRPGANGQTQNLGQLLSMAQMMAPAVGVNMKLDQELPVVGVQLALAQSAKQRMPPSVLSMVNLLLKDGLDIGIGFEGSCFVICLVESGVW